MSETTCTLTTKDFTILEVMLDRCQGTNRALAVLLRQKLDAARVVFREDVPEDVATLSSRLVYRVNNGPPDTRIISHAPMGSSVGIFLPITNSRGLALLGLSTGQMFGFRHVDGHEEQIVLDKVLYQPEAERRRKDGQRLASLDQTDRRRAVSLVHSTEDVRATASGTVFEDDPDDPGPTAA